jgi:protein O-GlcNAc transferase
LATIGRRRAASLDATAPEIRNNLGEVLVRLQRYQEAVASFDEALALSQNYAPAWYGKARALFHLKQNASCREACHRFLTLAESDDPLIPTAQKWLELFR